MNKKTQASDLPIGTRIYYTGDMANGSSQGTVVAYYPRTRYSPESVDILLDDERFDGDTSRMAKRVPLIAFDPSPGRRFHLLAEYEAERKARLEEMQRRFAR